MIKSVTVAEVGQPQVVVVGMFQGEPLASTLPKRVAWAEAAVAASQRGEATGEAGKIAEAFPGGDAQPQRVIILGLGKRDKFKPEGLRTAFASVVRRLGVTRQSSVLLAISPALDLAQANIEHAGRCCGEAAGLLTWDNHAFKGKATEKKDRPEVTIAGDKKALTKGLEFGVALAGSVNYARSLSETPPNIATPAYISDLAKKLAKDCGLEFSVLRGKELEKEKLVGHINVGKASENDPHFIRLKYSPEKPGKKKDKPAVLIGKTMTYDTGGLSLKINNAMVGMKRDKDGGCAVLGAMHAIATLIKPDRPVVALLCSAENSISDEAYRPDDVITYRNGVTVEITNTDAEGRLVLADGYCWACDKEDPAYIVELSTLTGGVVTALGSTYCGMFCDDDKLRSRVEEASATSGERVWRLPMHQEYRDMMKSPIADILNSNPNRKAHAGQGAAFLSYFVKEGVPWCHLDIAGVHVSESDSGPFVKGPNGWGVRVLADLLAQD
jgi:leucyl aminopeptidase